MPYASLHQMSAQPKAKITVEDYVAWGLGQPAGRYELVGGEIVAQAPERARHNLAKAGVYKALDAGVRKAGLPCTVFTDGMTIKIDAYTAREPDAAVQCGVAFDPATVFLDAPVIVVEVISASSERADTGSKLVEYFSIASIMHYLIVDPEKRAVIHHQRDGAKIATAILTEGEVSLTPPGLQMSIADALGDG